MRIGGIIPLSLVDYPQKPAITIFTSGCNLRCPFCHNSELITGEGKISESKVFELLHKRVGEVEAVCISGGEPTIHDDLEDWIREIRALGYSVKLDTNGARPKAVATLLADDLLDYVAVDIKSSPSRYGNATGGRLEFAVVAEVIDCLKESGIAYELRTTAVPSLVELEDIKAIAQEIGLVQCFALQQFRPGKTLDPAFGKIRPHPQTWFEEAKRLLQDKAATILVRGL